MSLIKQYALQIAGLIAATLVGGFVVYGFATQLPSEPAPGAFAEAESPRTEATESPSTAPPLPLPGNAADPVAPEAAVTGVQGGESFGPPAPDFTLATLDGGTFELADQAGKVVVVNFWATWCAPCREEIPGFIALQREMEEDGVVFVGLSEDEEGFDAVRPFARQMGINYPVAIDPRGAVAESFGAGYALPVSFLINRKGQVVAHLPGLVPEPVLRSMLNDLILEGGS